MYPIYPPQCSNIHNFCLNEFKETDKKKYYFENLYSGRIFNKIYAILNRTVSYISPTIYMCIHFIYVTHFNISHDTKQDTLYRVPICREHVMNISIFFINIQCLLVGYSMQAYTYNFIKNPHNPTWYLRYGYLLDIYIYL